MKHATPFLNITIHLLTALLTL